MGQHLFAIGCIVHDTVLIQEPNGLFVHGVARIVALGR